MDTLAAPVYALPLDMLRVAGGAVLFCYFAQAWRQAADFSDPDGLIDHRLCAKLFPPTRWSLFQPRMPGWFFRSAFACACLASVAVAVGWHPRAAAAFLFAIAASAYRWNVLAAYLDDAIVHLLCLWLVLLPVGETLALPSVLGGGADADWVSATVPGAAPRALLANLALVYVVAGLYKFTSPMWRNGSAMHAALKMPVARFPDFWTLRHRQALRVVNYAALILEPLFPLVFVLPANSALKWFLAGCAVVFHGGIAATLKIPYANAAMLAALPLAFGAEIMQGGLGLPAPAHAASRSGVEAGVGVAANGGGPAGSEALASGVALALVGALAVMFAWEAARTRRRLGKPYREGRWGNPVCFLLWWAGVFQSYRLFDWVDARNYHVRYEVHRIPADGRGAPRRLDSRHLFPGGMRYLLLQSYLLGNVWLQMDAEALSTVRDSLLVRHAQRYAKRHPNAGLVEAIAVVQRVTADNLTLARGHPRFLMRFECRGGRAVLHSLG